MLQPPTVEMTDILAQLSDRGKVEWELALAKAQLVKALQELQSGPAAPAPSAPAVAEGSAGATG